MIRITTTTTIIVFFPTGCDDGGEAYLCEINVLDPLIDKVFDGVHLGGGVESKHIDGVPFGERGGERRRDEEGYITCQIGCSLLGLGRR